MKRCKECGLHLARRRRYSTAADADIAPPPKPRNHIERLMEEHAPEELTGDYIEPYDIEENDET